MAKNVYDKPSAFGLTLVGTVEADLWYEFDITAAWEKDGRVYAARDSGNSSAEPFDIYTDITHLTEIRDAEKLRSLSRSRGPARTTRRSSWASGAAACRR